MKLKFKFIGFQTSASSLSETDGAAISSGFRFKLSTENSDTFFTVSRTFTLPAAISLAVDFNFEKLFHKLENQDSFTLKAYQEQLFISQLAQMKNQMETEIYNKLRGDIEIELDNKLKENSTLSLKNSQIDEKEVNQVSSSVFLASACSCKPALDILEKARQNPGCFFSFGIFSTFLCSLLLNFNSDGPDCCFGQPYSQKDYSSYIRNYIEKVKVYERSGKDRSYKVEKLYFDSSFYIPTFLLSSDFCSKLFENQKHSKNSVSYEKITHDFIFFRQSLIEKLNKISIECFVIVISQIYFWLACFFVSALLSSLDYFAKSTNISIVCKINNVVISSLENCWVASIFTAIFWFFLRKKTSDLLYLTSENSKLLFVTLILFGISVEKFLREANSRKLIVPSNEMCSYIFDL